MSTREAQAADRRQAIGAVLLWFMTVAIVLALIWWAALGLIDAKAQELEANPKRVLHIWKVKETGFGNSVIVVYKFQNHIDTRCKAVLYWNGQMELMGEVPCE